MRIKIIQDVIDKLRGKKGAQIKDLNYSANNFDRSTVIKEIHNIVKPELYLEIGIRDGYSLLCANKETEIIAIDPNPIIAYELPPKTRIFKETSDDFFKNHNIEKIYNKKVDLAFIDGMHLFDFVLRDFINVEKACRKDSVILLHDTIPIDAPSATRISTEKNLNYWSGDVYKIILILKEFRPDLELINFNVPKTGLCIVKNLDSTSTVLEENYDRIIEKYMNYSFDYIQERKNTVLDVTNIEYKNYKEKLNNELIEK